MGQELVARTHYQGLIRKRVIPVTLDPACTSAEAQHVCVGASVYAPGKARAIGTLRGCVGKLGIAHLRLEEAWEVLKQRDRLHVEIDGAEVALEPAVPHWWPRELRPALAGNLWL